MVPLDEFAPMLRRLLEIRRGDQRSLCHGPRSSESQPLRCAVIRFRNCDCRATESEPRHSRPRLARLATVIAALSISAIVGCPSPQSAPSGTLSESQSQQAALRREARADALFKAAVRQLNDLPAAIDTELRQPQVILDASKSGDGKDVLAVFLRNPSNPTGPINVVSVPQNNARFRTLGVKSGDILKYYVLDDETVDEASREAGFTQRVAMELIIAQVVDDQTLLVETGLNVEVPNPERIEIWRFVDERQREINRQLVLYQERRLPPLGWEPSPDSKTLSQIVVWLNQWLRQSNPKTEWRVEPLLQSLSPDLLSHSQLSPQLSKEALSATTFEPHEGRLLQEAVWHRDIARWARGESFNNVDRAAALFDWTVRNVQLEADATARPHRPWKVLAYGRGTAEQRAWVFALLCRQLGLDVVLLAFRPRRHRTTPIQPRPRPLRMVQHVSGYPHCSTAASVSVRHAAGACGAGPEWPGRRYASTSPDG